MKYYHFLAIQVFILLKEINTNKSVYILTCVATFDIAIPETKLMQENHNSNQLLPSNRYLEIMNKMAIFLAIQLFLYNT